MPKIRQHYVPKFYLNLFSSLPNRVNIYNIKNIRFIYDAGIKGQCYKKDLYGKDEIIENLIGIIEGENARIIKQIISDEYLPIQSSEDFDNLIGFIATQLQRTLKTADEIYAHGEKIITTIIKNSPNISSDEIEHLKEMIGDPIYSSLSFILFIFFGINDLSFHLIFSGNHRFFVTSDNPIVKYNQFAEVVRNVGKTGVLCRGLQIFCPLSPHYLLILYDPEIYNVPNKRKVSHYIQDNDVFQLNALQYLNASENLYFSDKQHEDQLKIISKAYKKYRGMNEIRIDEFDEVGNEVLSKLFVDYLETPNIHLNLSFLRIKRSAAKIPIRNRIHNYRKEIPDNFEGFSDSTIPISPTLFINKKTGKKILYKPRN